MADVKWIKIVTDIFDNRKIRQIESMPEGDSILVIWFKLICLAGNINDNGMIYFTQDIPYTEEMLATQFNRPIMTVRLALKTFEKFGMIEIVNDFLCLPSWEKYQSTERLDKIREQARIRKQRQRERERYLPENSENVTHVTQNVTQCHATDKDIDRDKDRERDKESNREAGASPTPAPVPYSKIKELYNSICTAYPKCTAMSDARKKAIAARIHSGYTVEDFQRVFEKAQASSFLKGGNNRNWRASFDWLLKDSNMAKVLDGNYDDKGQTTPHNPAADDLDFIPN